MEFKIDTKDAFSIIVPLATTIDAKLADAIAAECRILRQNGSNCYIIDMQNLDTAPAEAIKKLVMLHEYIYSQGGSLVFTGITTAFNAILKETETSLLLNIAPTMIEATDIVSMEILERDLMGEE